MEYILDVHCHTIASGHAYSTLEEIIDKASKKGLELVAITDHAPSMPGATSILYFQNLKVIPQEIIGVEVLKGVEANIISKDGDIDIDDETLKRLDIVIASLHPPCISFGTVEENTDTVINTMKNPYVDIIGHADDSRFPLDYDRIVKAAKEYNVLLEVNNSSLNPKGFRISRDNIIAMLNKCKEYNVPIVMGSDAHISYDVGKFDLAIELMRELDFPKELIINTSVEKLKTYLR